MERKVMFSPSLMCMDMLHIGEQLKELDKLCDMYHVDVMDGSYVKNYALTPSFVETIKPLVTKPIDVHMMVVQPQDYIEAFAKAGADYISPHADKIAKDAFRVINIIKELGCKAGIAINPSEPIEIVDSYIGRLDKITVMTVDPGFAGQKFIPEMLEKVRALAELREKKGYHYLIEIDGSCNESTFRQLTEAGADVLIVGSSGLFKNAENVSTAWRIMLEKYHACMK